ncbi:hypothetical protein K0M31_020214 [Melipona bicolor]|uniref:Uncharacterized protein n=1 Tax=Melipona bicolor TaxID=60889 RepID=A0AA40G119_9HYME|nr:hypothetical protein K0M31_020214 [Melipona bicolor]
MKRLDNWVVAKAEGTEKFKGRTSVRVLTRYVNVVLFRATLANICVSKAGLTLKRNFKRFDECSNSLINPASWPMLNSTRVFRLICGRGSFRPDFAPYFGLTETHGASLPDFELNISECRGPFSGFEIPINSRRIDSC